MGVSERVFGSVVSWPAGSVLPAPCRGRLRLCAAPVAWRADSAEVVWPVVVGCVDVVDLEGLAGAALPPGRGVPAVGIGELAGRVTFEDRGADGRPVSR